MAASLSLFTLFLLAMAFPTHSFRFDLNPEKVKCFFEDVKDDAIFVAKYAMVGVEGDDHLQHNSDPDIKISIKVTNPSGKDVHFLENVDSGDFAFKADGGGTYTACFWLTPGSTPTTTKMVDFDWKAGLAIRRHQPVLLVKAGIEDCKKQLENMEETVNSIQEELMDLRERGMEMRSFNMSTNSIMAWLSFLSFAICVLVAGAQVWHLKTFFQKKKVL